MRLLKQKWQEKTNKFIGSLHVSYNFPMEEAQGRRCLVYENTKCYLKNDWTKQRLVCSPFLHILYTDCKYGHERNQFWNIMIEV